MKKFFESILRLLPEFLMLAVLGVIFYYIPNSSLNRDSIDPKTAMSALFLSKAFMFSCAIIQGHLTRKVLFYYIYFQTEKDLSNNLMILLIYAGAFYMWANAG